MKLVATLTALFFAFFACSVLKAQKIEEKDLIAKKGRPSAPRNQLKADVEALKTQTGIVSSQVDALKNIKNSPPDNKAEEHLKKASELIANTKTALGKSDALPYQIDGLQKIEENKIEFWISIVKDERENVKLAFESVFEARKIRWSLMLDGALSRRTEVLKNLEAISGDIIALINDKDISKSAKADLINHQEKLNSSSDNLKKINLTNDSKPLHIETEQWFDDLTQSNRILDDGAEVAKAARGEMEKVRKAMRRKVAEDLSNLATEAETLVRIADGTIKSLPRELSETAKPFRTSAQDRLKRAQDIITAFSQLKREAESLYNDSLDWPSKLNTAKENATSAKTDADTATQNNEHTIISARSDAAGITGRAIEAADFTITSLPDKLPSTAEMFRKQARETIERSRQTLAGYRRAERNGMLAKENDTWLSSLANATADAYSAKGEADKAVLALIRHQWWMRVSWRVGAVLGLLIFGAGVYLLVCAWQHLNFLRREREMFLGYSHERGLLRLEVGPNSEGLSIHAPESLQKTLGYSVEKLAGMKLEDLVDPASHGDLKAVLERAPGTAEALTAQRVNWLLLTNNGRTVQVEGVLSVQIHKRKMRILAILEDVSWREKLSDAQMRIEAVGAHWTDGILVLNDRQEVILANEVFCRMFSLSSAPEKLRGLPLQKLGENVASSLLNTPLLSAQQPASLTMQTGSGITIQVEATPISAGARDLGRLLCFRDKTSQLKADEKLLPLIEHFRSSVPDSARCGIAVLSPDGRFLAVSEALCTFFGYSREELLRMSEERLITHSNGVATAKPADNRTPLRKSYRRRDGSSATARVQVTDWCNDQGTTIYSLMSLDDSGERHAPPKPAVWDPKVATGAWCPEAIEPHLPWLKNGFVYQDNYAQAAEAGIAGWALAGATRRGRLHAQHATHREDAFRWETGENFTIACVSDGAGSCRYSRIGSETVCREVTRLLREALNAAKPQFATADLEELTKIVAGAMGKSVWQACMSLRDLATKAQCEPKDFRCTLLLVVHYKSSAGTKILGSQIGDGLIEALMRDGSTRRYGTADSGEFAGQVSCFIPDDNAVTKAGMIFQIPPDELQALLICTDGIDDAFFPIEKLAGSVFRQYYFGTQQKLPGFEDQKTHGPILGSATDTAALQAWLDFEKRGENDDRTVLVLHRQPPEPHPPTIAAE